MIMVGRRGIRRTRRAPQSKDRRSSNRLRCIRQLGKEPRSRRRPNGEVIKTHIGQPAGGIAIMVIPGGMPVARLPAAQTDHGIGRLGAKVAVMAISEIMIDAKMETSPNGTESL